MTSAPTSPADRPASRVRWVRRGAGALALLLWGVSLFLPIFSVDLPNAARGDVTYVGSDALIYGWMALYPSAAFSLAWFANPLFLILAAFVLFGRRPNRWLATAAALLAWSAFITRQGPGSPWGAGDGPLTWLVGAFVWAAGFAPLLALAWLQRKDPPAAGA